MNNISFRDIENNKDVYSIIIKYLTDTTLNKKVYKTNNWRKMWINTFKNYTDANKRTLLDPLVVKEIKKLVVHNKKQRYLEMGKEEAFNYLCFTENHGYLKNVLNRTYFNLDSIHSKSMNEIFIESDYFKFTEDNELNTKIKNMLYNLINDFLNKHTEMNDYFGNLTDERYGSNYYDNIVLKSSKAKYFHLMETFLFMAIAKNESYFSVTFCMFITSIIKNLKKITIDKEIKNKVLIDMIDSIDWTRTNLIKYKQ
jgi:hypothetical protein